ncbi:hypothetical protein NicSoilC5_03460 [Arthrobacter sp. NicSoilC5]|nr:hypothetical protein NicSoilC5_03460 [Arthrobacter sp. NicSoilC5]
MKGHIFPRQTWASNIWYVPVVTKTSAPLSTQRAQSRPENEEEEKIDPVQQPEQVLTTSQLKTLVKELAPYLPPPAEPGKARIWGGVSAAVGFLASVATVAGLFFVGIQIQQGNEAIKGANLSIAFPSDNETRLKVQDDGVVSMISSDFTFILTNTGRMPITILDFTEPDQEDHRMDAHWIHLPELSKSDTQMHKNEPLVLPPGEGALVRVCSEVREIPLPWLVLSDGQFIHPDSPVTKSHNMPKTVADAIETMPKCG